MQACICVPILLSKSILSRLETILKEVKVTEDKETKAAKKS
jgi:hypothetical protein